MRLGAWALAMAFLAGTACGGGASKPDGGGMLDGGGGRWVGTLALTQVPLDVLFVIDDSASMKPAQDKLIRSFPTFMSRLQDPPGLPSLHIAVVSQDMGAGDGSIPRCDSERGRKGIFQYAPRGPCVDTTLEPGATYIENAGGVRNYTGNIGDVFACIAALGDTGCDFEHHFAAITRALGVDGVGAAPTENQGFLRPEAILAVIMLTNEDDCSPLPGGTDNGEIPFFDTTVNTNIASQLGPPGNFRCNEFGHTCEKAGGTVGHPDRNAPGNDVSAEVSYISCSASEDLLLSTRHTADALRSLKANPAQVVVVSIQAPSSPYTVRWKSPGMPDSSCGAASCPWPEIEHSCAASDGSFGDPGVRTEALAEQFGDNGLVLPICADDFAPSMDLAATLLKSRAVAPCLPGPIGSKAATPSAPDCKVTEHYVETDGIPVDKELPFCSDNGNTAPCWRLHTMQAACAHPAIRVMADPDVPPGASPTFTYDCAKCTTGGGCID